MITKENYDDAITRALRAKTDAEKRQTINEAITKLLTNRYVRDFIDKTIDQALINHARFDAHLENIQPVPVTLADVYHSVANNLIVEPYKDDNSLTNWLKTYYFDGCSKTMLLEMAKAGLDSEASKVLLSYIFGDLVVRKFLDKNDAISMKTELKLH